MVRVGVIGLGSIAWLIDQDTQRKGTWSHMGAYHKSTRTQIQSICSREDGVCRQVQKIYSVPDYFTDYRTMLSESDLDVVSICTPIESHYAILMEAVSVGVKAVFCEKTLSYDVGKAEEMVDACQRNDVVLAVNFVKRWDSVCQHVRELITSGAVGDLRTIVAYGATALHTSASHLIDLMCLYAGTPRWVIGELDCDFVRNVHGVDDPGGIGMVKFNNGVTGFIKATSLNPNKYMSELDLVGTHGRARLADDGKTLRLFRFSETASSPGSGFETLVEEDVSIPSENDRMVDAVEDIVTCLHSGDSPRSSGYTSLDTLRIIDGIRRSSANDNVKIYV